MVHKVLIVDDEDLMRDGLTNLVNWKSMGYEVVATLEDGRDAIEYIQKYEIHAILTDIKMTFISGIELAKYVAENKLDIKVVIISGFQEFELARQAMKYNVSHYLLKPPRLKDIQSVFEEIKQQLDTESEERERAIREKEQYDEVISLLKEQFFTDIVLGALRNEDEVMKRVKLLNLKIDPKYSNCCTVDLKIESFDDFISNNWEYGKDGLYNAVKNYLQVGNAGILCVPVSFVKEKMKFLIISQGSMELENFEHMVQKHLNTAQEGITSFLGLNITYSLNKCHKGLVSLANEIYTVEKTIERGIGIKEDSGGPTGMTEQVKLLVSHIGEGNCHMVQSILESFFGQMNCIDIKDVHRFVIDLFSLLNKRLTENGMDFNKDNSLDINEIKTIGSLEGIRSWVDTKVTAIIKSLEKSRSSSNKNVIDRAKSFIRDNYNTDITLEDIADYIFLNPVYFSRLFKEQTGENYIDYLIKVRMEKAEELLQDPRYKVHEISSMVGYESNQYFYKVFKRYRGQTPTEYRKSLWGEAEESYEQN